MTADNSITLVGNVTEDPELRFTPSGQAVANFTVAVNRRFKNNQGQWEDRLDGFFRCNCWREMAENVAESLKKGMRIVVTGRLQQRSWDDPEGKRRSTLEIQVDDVGPSLRWATAQVTKGDKSGARSDWSDRQQQPAPAGDWNQGQQQPAPAGGWNQGQSAPAPRTNDWGGQPAAAPSPVPDVTDEGGF